MAIDGLKILINYGRGDYCEKMNTKLTLLDTNSSEFFKILPLDWQQTIVPFWDDYMSTAKIYIFKENNTIIAGGIVFSTCPPDMKSHSEEAQKWFNNGYFYIGFLYVVESHRNKKLGSQWIDALKKSMPDQSFWLVIEDEGLGTFYEKHQFKMEKIIQSGDTTEWLYAFKPEA